MLKYKKIFSKKANSTVEILIFKNTHLFFYSHLTNEYRYTNSSVWIKNFTKVAGSVEKVITDFPIKIIDEMIDTGKKSLVDGKMKPIQCGKFKKNFKSLKLF
tara:strand:+ start:180 stop:485 length:306 start_codon:yes stop_codon:yes gene_type:complete